MNKAGSKSKQDGSVLNPTKVHSSLIFVAKIEPSSKKHGAWSGLAAPPMAQTSDCDGKKTILHSSSLMIVR